MKDGIFPSFSVKRMDKQIIDLIDKLIKTEVRPIGGEVEESCRYPREIFRKFGEEKILGMPFPDKYGGMGLEWKYLVYFARKLSYASGAIAEAILSHLCMGVSPIFNFGTEAQKDAFLVPALSGEAVAGMAIAEPDAGSDMRKIRMVATATDDGFRLNGNKVFISNADYFDFMIFAARLDGELSLFIIERKGNEERITTKPLQMMGMHGADIGEIFLDGAFCPGEHLLGKQGEGVKLIMESLNFARLLGAACCFGIMAAAYDYGLKYAKEREQFGKRLVGFQSLKFMLVDMAARVDISRLLLDKATDAFEKGAQSVKHVSLAKLYISEAARELTDNMMHLLGAYGYCKEYPVERFLRDAHCFTIGEGTSEIQREILAREYGIN